MDDGAMRRVQDSLQAVEEYLQYAERFKDVPGYLFDTEGWLLLRLAEHGPGQGAVVEIGSFMGRSTCWLAAGAVRAGREKVFAIDTFQGSAEHQGDEHIGRLLAQGKLFDVFRENLRKHDLLDQVTPLVGGSQEIVRTWDAPIRLLFIDGDHSYEGVARDFIAWERHVVPGGVVALHDVGVWDGVTNFYAMNLKRNKRYREAADADSLRAFVKLP